MTAALGECGGFRMYVIVTMWAPTALGEGVCVNQSAAVDLDDHAGLVVVGWLG